MRHGRPIAFTLLLATTLVAGSAAAAPVLFISVDGLRPGEVIEADKRGLKIPNLRRFLVEGSFAEGVTGVLPTVTYPSHTTLVTGAAPARHGVVSNTTFDPMGINYGGWYWYAEDIHRPTLWEAAAKAGMTTANVHWPVSVGAKGVTWNLPQIWRSGHADDAKLVRAVATPDLIAELEQGHDAYPAGIDETIEGDEHRAAFAMQLMDRHKPQFITVYLTALDHQQHLSGPGTPEAHSVLERIDAQIGRLIEVERRNHPDAVIALASDHGFAPIDTEINLFRPFLDAGLVTLGADGKVASWEAEPWPSGGSAAIVLARPDDQALVQKVGTLLRDLAQNPAARIARVIDRTDIARFNANPQASFFVDLKQGATTAGFKGKDAPLSAPSNYKGMHGYFPDEPEMRSTFLIMGPGVAKARNLGQIDMRAIAPTLAKVMGAALPDAEAKPLF